MTQQSMLVTLWQKPTCTFTKTKIHFSVLIRNASFIRVARKYNGRGSHIKLWVINTMKIGDLVKVFGEGVGIVCGELRWEIPVFAGGDASNFLIGS